MHWRVNFAGRSNIAYPTVSHEAGRVSILRGGRSCSNAYQTQRTSLSQTPKKPYSNSSFLCSFSFAFSSSLPLSSLPLPLPSSSLLLLLCTLVLSLSLPPSLIFLLLLLRLEEGRPENDSQMAGKYPTKRTSPFLKLGSVLCASMLQREFLHVHILAKRHRR